MKNQDCLHLSYYKRDTLTVWDDSQQQSDWALCKHDAHESLPPKNTTFNTQNIGQYFITGSKQLVSSSII